MNAANTWETLPPPAPLPPAETQGYVDHDGARIFHAIHGAGPPVMLLHETFGNGEHFGNQVPALVGAGYRAILIDSRGQGRSTRDARPFSYALMVSDVLVVMDALGLGKASFVGWSDGAIIGLILAMKHPERVTRAFAFGANMDPGGIAEGAFSLPIMRQAAEEARQDYIRLSETPNEFRTLSIGMTRMFRGDPNYTEADLALIRGPPIAIVHGEREEFIRPGHAEYLARAIPDASLIVLPDVSHFAPWQNPEGFNAAMLGFLAAP